MLGVKNEIYLGLQHIRAIACRWSLLDLFPKDPTCFDRPYSTDKAEDLTQNGVHLYPEPMLGLSQAMRLQEFINFNEGAGFGLQWACWECWGGLYQIARDRLWMDAENLIDSSYPHPFQIELTGLLLEGRIFATL